MTVRRKLAASVGILLLLSTGSAWLALMERQRAAHALDELHALQRDLRDLANLTRALDLRSREMRVLAAVSPTPAQVAELRARLVTLDMEARRLSASTLSDEFVDTAARLRTSWASALTALEQGRTPEDDPVSPDALMALLDQARAAREARVDTATTAFVDAQREADRAAALLLGGSIVCGTIVVLFLSLTVRRGLATIEEASRHMGQGDYAYRIAVRGDDEFTRAGERFNAMADELAEAIDEARAARQRAEDASATKSRFLMAMSHDLRTPLTAALGFTELIEEDVASAGLTATLADVAQLRKAVDVMEGMVGELLELGKLEGGRLPVSRDEVDVAALAADVAEGIRPLAAHRHNVIVLEAPDCCRVVTDAPKVRHVLQNLIGNASKFTERGAVTVRVAHWTDREGHPGLELSVADTGIGMTATEMQRIFEPFRQANPSVQARFGGTGLGLAIARGYVDLLDGTIEVVSAPGQGTTFTVRLPAQAATDAGAPVAAVA